MPVLICRILLLAALAVSGVLHAEEPVRVFAASSLTNALNDIGEQWRKSGHRQPVLAYGASSMLAKQIEAGAPADLFASADLGWMDFLERRGRLAPGTRTRLLGNELVLIVPRGHRLPIQLRRGFNITSAFRGKLCTGEPGVVPVGIYARQSLESLGWWQALQGRIVGTDDVRTALAFVERGECALGIVYASDAKISSKVEVLARVPSDTHQPIVYPFAAIKDGRPEAMAFLRFLRTPIATSIFVRYGFSRLPR